MSNLDDFLSGYAYVILWANAYRYNEDGELEPDENATYAYHGPGKWWEGIGMDLGDARAFYDAEYDTLSYLTEFSRAATWERHGHDFALTRNGHGAGFWDRGYGTVGDRLAERARTYGEHTVITDDGPTVTNM